jgi:hypothetical protein
MLTIPIRWALLALVLLPLSPQSASAFYDPGLQRWINRDPIQEDGGLNLYLHASGDPVDRHDLLGLSDENRPPEVVGPSGSAQYGPPCRLSPDQCAALLASIVQKAAKLKDQLAKYNPSTDGKGGYPMPGGGVTKPGGHYFELQNLIRGLRKDISKYLKDCGGGGNPPVPREVFEAVSTKVPLPIIRVPRMPIVIPVPPPPGLVPVPAFP